MQQDSKKAKYSHRFVQFYSLISEHKSLLLTGILLLLICTAMSLWYPQLFRVIVDEALASGDAQLLQNTLLLLGLSFTIFAIAGALRYWTFSYAGEKLVNSLRSKMYQHVMSMDIAFFDSHSSGDLLSRLSNDIQGLQNTLSQDLALLLRYFTTGLGGLILLFYTSSSLTILLLLLIPPTAWASGKAGNVIRRYSAQTQDAVAMANAYAQESFSGIRTIRSFNQEQSSVQRYSAKLIEGLHFSRKRITVISGLEAGVVYVSSMSMVAIVWYGTHLVLAGDISVGQLTSFLLYTFLVTSSLSGITNIWAEFTKAAGAVDRVFDILSMKPAVVDRGWLKNTNIRGKLDFKSMGFAYPGHENERVIHDFNLSIEAGQCIALVGVSGGGKSTLASLISRFYDPVEGCIQLDGEDLKNYQLNWLRAQIALVEQEPIIFSSSIAENICLGGSLAAEEQIVEAAKAANAHEFICQLPDGYQTRIGSAGIQLSGGQKQRLAIARALLKSPKILLLDEATSALDAKNESEIAKVVARLKGTCTTIIIAHRLSTVKSADRIVVLDKGNVIQSGTHQQLLQQADKMYAQLVEQQLGK